MPQIENVNAEDSIAQEFSMTILKATVKDGEMRWRSVNSDIEEDVYGEKMSKELFEDFKKHIDNNEPIPEQFKAICEEDWCGGMPYVSISHYKTGTGKVNVPGEVKSLYTDGKALKSTGILYDTPLGMSVFKSLQKDLVEKRDNKIRISIGFLDLEHSHGDKFTFTRKSVTDKCPLCKKGIKDKIYKKGYLVHLALTRVPANPRTELELKSMTTKREDAESIIEDEEVLKMLELKSQTEPEILVVKADDADEDDCPEGDEECKKKMAAKKKEMDAKHAKMMKEEKSAVEENTVVSPEPVVEPVVVVASTTDPRGYKEVSPAPELTPLQKSVASLVERVNVLKSQGAVGDAALSEIQSQFDELGKAVKAEFTPAPTPEDVATKNIENTLRSLLSEMLPSILAQTVAPIQSEIAELRSVSAAKPVIKKEEVHQPRNLNYSLVQKQAIDTLVQKTESQFARIARESVGLQ